MLLAIDTATDFAGLALYDRNCVWDEEVWFAARNHTVTLMPRLNTMLASVRCDIADLEAIVVSLGPGSYTGVRIAVSVAKGLALPHGLPVVGIPTLDVTAYPHRTQSRPVIAVAQAGRKRLLAAPYLQQDEGWAQIHPPAIYTIEELVASLSDPVLMTGELRAEDIAYIEQREPTNIDLLLPFDRVRRPSILAHLGKLKLDNSDNHTLDQLEPIYLNEP
ncbi:MAG: tRNA (adenosine(37)-N6)-threonylcarbamoyltransferase complex dimerization subunit type 1 TsaB [Chloroflexota bacterium]